MNDVSVVVPAFNEEARLEATLRALRKIPDLLEIIVVNDGSRDDTSAIAHLYADRVIDLPQNQGKGRALQEGWRMATGEIIVCVDADLEKTAVEVKHLLDAIREKGMDVTISLFKPGSKAGLGFVRRRAQSIVYRQTGVFISAPLSGQRAFRRKWLDVLLKEQYEGFGVETKMTIDLLKSGAKIMEVETTMAHREMGKSFRGFLHRFKQWREIERHVKVVRK
ncbi:glycosyltransferase family 2 protein [Bacillus sp. FJAT-45037]|uniref:glycosyltransferase family 2 protein n=1 Tax=Bacillus sp. FJAT-45037 TaxID=2011007 RepID=UPI000C24E006|nr:glycosyltransferase family 2 protein [Bacillus sp. FJAT-45037]